MRPMSRRGGWLTVLRAAGLVLLVLLSTVSCANKKRGLAGIGGGALPHGDVADPCAVPNTGCACEDAEAEVECGTTISDEDGIVTCAKGTRHCVDNQWSECSNTHTEQQSADRRSFTMDPEGLGSQAKCPTGYDAC